MNRRETTPSGFHPATPSWPKGNSQTHHSPSVMKGWRGTSRGSYWFTLVEVLVACVLMGSVFFGIVHLLANNTRDAVRIESGREMDHIFASSKACIESFGLATLLSTTATQSLNFGSDHLSCLTGSYDTAISFTGISLTTTQIEDDTITSTGEVTYWSYFKNTPTASGSVQVKSYITDGTQTKSYDFEVWR